MFPAARDSRDLRTLSAAMPSSKLSLKGSEVTGIESIVLIILAGGFSTSKGVEENATRCDTDHGAMHEGLVM